MTNTKLSKLFITGCDSNTNWMLDWFKTNYSKHNDTPLHVFDFDKEFKQAKGWFKKPAAMMAAAKMADSVCWLDTDCEVLGNIEGIFDYVEPEKLSMVEDKPWSKRRQETWHNSGVVAFTQAPRILWDWELTCSTQPTVGDQEVLHLMMDSPLKRMMYIRDVPNKYNVLRLQHIDNTVPEDALVYHWTGKKGKEHIQGLMRWQEQST